MRTLSLVFALAVAQFASAQSTQYRVTLLDRAGYAGSVPTGISNDGVVSGALYNPSQPGSQTACWWDPNGQVHVYTGMTTTSSCVVTSTGEFLFRDSDIGGRQDVRLRTVNGTEYQVPIDGGFRFAGTDISNGGVVTYSTTNNDIFRWDPVHGTQFVTNVPGTTPPNIRVSPEGMITGTTNTLGGVYSAYALTPQGRVDLSDFLIYGSSPGNRFCGRGTNLGGGIWTPGVGYEAIEAPVGTALWPTDVNSAGIVVGGISRAGNSDDTGMIKFGNNPWVDFGTVSDFGSVGALSYSLHHINESGVITGKARFNDRVVGFIARPVPEPSSLLAWGVGWVLVAGRRRKSFRRPPN